MCCGSDSLVSWFWLILGSPSAKNGHDLDRATTWKGPSHKDRIACHKTENGWQYKLDNDRVVNAPCSGDRQRQHQESKSESTASTPPTIPHSSMQRPTQANKMRPRCSFTSQWSMSLPALMSSSLTSGNLHPLASTHIIQPVYCTVKLYLLSSNAQDSHVETVRSVGRTIISATLVTYIEESYDANRECARKEDTFTGMAQLPTYYALNFRV